MKIHGYCDRCHRVKLVRVSNQGMVRLAMRQIATGICDACQENEDEKTKRRMR